MAEQKPTRARKVPPAKKTYEDPADEPRSEATQVAADRFLHGRPTNPDGTVRGVRS